ncbi:vasoactive intestinal polypeptide receptor 2 isoform X1 [Diabrotica virgifera virgifera]|uniref:Parathyroid hormone/parathyroid hormone-related peptide receptor n=1 Tax=Diabrotica virgifera virgifera TaxID=50390 RepID=A0ABM5L3W8_DIAVI|nr:vasoactive intestinal polypeptide receptor 2 isoform X1 [Diabrotica virgifera virgifera]XP_050517125.1 vasoactive intestinal polypeptide receptor 2 isoform X1 [Diabrotica virgifera virgifera]XP_050517127.1 vasoactive intestinal polypeptide receptor 2 isoform X1 [Diabrotica virgifera virgifera]XP_050517128.1 vasoactive intestinal polypeptide receptor 2 isoform X1 [Diabrotica virgifera virgifera]
MPNRHIQIILEKQDRELYLAEQNCTILYGPDVKNKHQGAFYNRTSQNLMCPPFWDSIICWPYTPAGEKAVIPCPSYFAGFREDFNATRTCTENGTWYVNSSTHEPWGDYTACSEGRIATIFTNITSKSDLWKRYETLVPILKIISQTGYAVSLLSLIAAFIIMLSIKKLHCARNILHMNLFASFIFRALFHILKEILFVEGVGLQIDFSEKNGDLYFKTDIEQNNYQCKLLTSLVQFFTTANYSWILMEGLYLNNLIWRALFVDSSRNLVYYICLGWGLPIFVIIPWIIARIFLDDTMCWTTNDNVKAYLIIVIPTIIAVLINFALFIIISIVLYTKLRSPICEDTKRYQKWARSTLVLVPLFGVHYAVLLIFYFTGKTDIWLICDSLFGSFQGLFVAILYCFMNGEVKTELKPHIYNFLSYLATHPILGICFPCRAKFLRSAVGRRSVCTTLSYSSIYVNGVGHRNSKSKFIEKGRHPNQEKNHCCNGKHPSTKNGVQVGIKHVGDGQAETSLCNDQRSEKCRMQSCETDEEICMLTKSC